MQTLMDPTNEARPIERSRAERLSGIEGKTIGLLDISKARGDVFLDHLSSLLESKGAKIERFSKPTFTRPAPVDLRQQIAERCDAVIEALAD